ncbi:MAG: gliding motility-associated C-terminal domain-containing protein, partial [Cyclobacteriaceae bacterium]|nr:gliding motility-associated C-terminal domain-containing protein [Cyclobacteriaceae bacterium]
PIDLEANTAIITWEEPVAKDACSEISMRSNYASGSVFDYGIITIVYTATDQSGNEAYCSFDVGSENNRPPLADNLSRKVKAGESIDIYLNARDPDDDHVSIVSIFHNENNATISSVDAGNLSFIYTSFIDFYGTDTVLVELFDNGLPSCSTISEVVIEVERNTEIEVSSAITSNGDYVNEFLFIKNIDLFPENSVHIFDRWGGLLYQATRYNNESIAWRGTNDRGNFGNKKYTPTGTYFYVIDLGDGSDKITGAVEVIR